MRLIILALAAGLTGFSASAADVELLKSGGTLPKGLPLSDGFVLGPLVLMSGQIGNEPGTLKIVEGGLEAEFKQVMDNVMSVLRVNGLNSKNVVKCTIMLADIKDFSTFNKIYSTYFVEPFPARSTFAVAALALNAKAELECIAAR